MMSLFLSLHLFSFAMALVFTISSIHNLYLLVFLNLFSTPQAESDDSPAAVGIDEDSLLPPASMDELDDYLDMLYQVREGDVEKWRGRPKQRQSDREIESNGQKDVIYMQS